MMGNVVRLEFLSRRLQQIEPLGVETKAFHGASKEFFTVATIRFNREIYTRVTRVLDQNSLHFIGAVDIYTAIDDGASLLIPMGDHPKDSA